MFRVTITVPEASVQGECVFLLSNQVASLIIPSSKSVTIEALHLKPTLTLRCILKLPLGQSARLDLALGELFPELSGSVDTWFELEVSASTPRSGRSSSFSKESRSATVDSLSLAKPQLRLSVSLNRVDSQSTSQVSTEICPRCGSLSKIVASQQEEINQLKEKIQMRLSSSSGFSTQSSRSLAQDGELASIIKDSLNSINSKWDALQAANKEVERLRSSLGSSPNSQSQSRLFDFGTRPSSSNGEDFDRRATIERGSSTHSLRGAEYQDVQSELDSLRAMLNSIEVEKRSMYERMNGYFAEIKDWQTQHETDRSFLERERQSMMNAIDQLNGDLKQKDREVADYKAEAIILRQEAEHNQRALSQKDDELAHLKDVEACLKVSEESREQLSLYFAEQLKNLEDRFDSLQAENTKIKDENLELSRSVRVLTSQLEAKQSQLIDLERVKAQNNERIAELERQVRDKEDSRIQDDLQRYLNLTDQLQQQLLSEMDSLKRRVELQPEQVQRVELQPEQVQRVTYDPIKGDEIDQGLADYLNKKEHPLPVPFRREEPGVYTFGSKKVFIKIEQGKIIIRVGGGFMSIDDFIDIYTPIELEKYSRPREPPSKERLISKLVNTIDESSDYVTCVGLHMKSVSPSRRRSRTPSSASNKS